MDKDMSRQAVESSAAILFSAKKKLQTVIPYGPDRVKLSAEELRKKLENPRTNNAQQILSLLGPEKALQLLSGNQKPLWPEGY